MTELIPKSPVIDRHRRFRLVYYGLVVFVLLTVGLSLGLVGHVTRAFEQSVAVNREWALKTRRLADLRNLVSAVNRPGNDLFDSHDVSAERAKADKAIEMYRRRFRELHQEYSQQAGDALAPVFLKLLDELDAKMNEMVAELREVFGHYLAGDLTKSISRMAWMDRKHNQTQEVIGSIINLTRRIRDDNLQSHADFVSSMRPYEHIVAGLILVIVCGAAVYGHQMTVRMRQTQRELEEHAVAMRAATQAKSDFLANMSHEIRTPMTAILGYADLLQQAGMPEEERGEYLRIIRLNGQHLLLIINDILDISKIESGQMSVESLVVDLPRLMREVEALMRGRALEKGIGLGFRLDANVPGLIRTDPTRLRQILLNLLSNAIKFTEQGRVSVDVSRGTDDGGDGVLRIDVIDTGVGLNPEQLGRLFTPFFQADGTTTRRYGGTGLGLSISRRLARMLGGDISVVSSPGAGSTFTATIKIGRPVATEGDGAGQGGNSITGQRAAAVAIGRTLESPANTSGASGRSGWILLAEDNPVNQMLIKRILTGAGLRVELAGNGRIAVEMVQKAVADGDPHQVILMDMQMPEMDGYQAAALLRSRGVRTPIIALTAHAMAEDRKRCLDAGCTDYATKPVDRTKLLELIGGYLSQAENIGHPEAAVSAV